MVSEKVDVGRVETEAGVESGLVGLLSLDGAVGSDLQPLRLVLRGVVVPLHGGVDGHANVERVSGFDLVGEQVAGQVGVAAFGVRLGVVVDHAVMTAGEAGDRVYVGLGEHLRPCGGVEFGADCGDLLAGVEVEVDLTVAEEVLHGAGAPVVFATGFE